MSANTSFVTTADGTLWGWGDNSSDQLAEAAIDNTVPQRTIPGVAPQSLIIPNVTATIGKPTQLYANSTSELPATFNVSGPATVSGYSLMVNGPGAVNLMGYQPGNEDWGSTGPVSVPMRILPAGNGAGN